MICEEFDKLSHRERIEYIGKLVHSVQSHSYLFELGQMIVNHAEATGLLTDVIINPTNEEPKDT